MNKIVERLKQEFHDEDYRYAYDEEFSNSRMATQTRAIREERGLTQKELAEIAEMKQSRISELENVNYNAWSVSTLRRLAKALGVRLFFGFESWGELLPEVSNFNRSLLQKPEFEKDIAFKKAGKRAKSRKKSSISNTNPNQPRLRHLQIVRDSNTLSQPNTESETLDAYMNGSKERSESSFHTALNYGNQTQNFDRKAS